MIAAIQGRLAGRGADFALVEVGGVTLRVLVPASSLQEIGDDGDIVRLHTFLYVREDQLALYGFVDLEQLNFFNLLLTVQGIGPSAALTILSAQPVEQLRDAISREDTAQLSRIPRIGKKTAQRLILDLKGKIGTGGGLNAVVTDSNNEVVEALTALGYSAAQVQGILNGFNKDENGSPVEDKIMLALRRLGSEM